MLFKYQAITETGERKAGTIDALNSDSAIYALQRKNLIVSEIKELNTNKGFLGLSFFKNKIKTKDIVIMSRQIATLFESNVTALKVFTLLAENTENKSLVKVLNEITLDIQSGMSISNALGKHPEVFSDFYVNMVRSGEESGKLIQVFSYLAEYLDRQYQLTSKTKNALVYPSFVIGVFVIVMTLMMVFIVPKLTDIIKESGQNMPFSTKIIVAISDALVNYGFILLIFLVAFIFYLVHYFSTEKGKIYMDNMKISVPVIGLIYKKLYLTRIADNMNTMLSSGVTIIKSIEMTGAVVGNRVYESIMKEVLEDVKAGRTFSDSMSKHKEIPTIMSGMIRVGEETGSMGSILKTLGNFYSREVNEQVDTMVNLIEPIMIIALGVGVGLLLTSVLMPIYNIAGGLG